VRDPWKVLSNSFCGYRQWNFNNYALRVCKSTAQCELSLAQGVPVLQSWLSKALYELRDVKQSKDDSISDLFYLGARRTEETRPINMETRLSFERAFGIDVAQQIDMERHGPKFTRGWDQDFILRSSVMRGDHWPSELLWEKPYRCD
jgi:hypothetical protein